MQKKTPDSPTETPTTSPASATTSAPSPIRKLIDESIPDTHPDFTPERSLEGFYGGASMRYPLHEISDELAAKLRSSKIWETLSDHDAVVLAMFVDKHFMPDTAYFKALETVLGHRLPLDDDLAIVATVGDTGLLQQAALAGRPAPTRRQLMDMIENALDRPAAGRAKPASTTQMPTPAAAAAQSSSLLSPIFKEDPALRGMLREAADGLLRGRGLLDVDVTAGLRDLVFHLKKSPERIAGHETLESNAGNLLALASKARLAEKACQALVEEIEDLLSRLPDKDPAIQNRMAELTLMRVYFKRTHALLKAAREK